MIVIKTMKKIIYLLITLCIYSINAQNGTIQDVNIVPLESYQNYKTDDNLQFQKGMYFKDVNNLLVPYVGSWLGSYDNKTIEMQISILENVVGPNIALDKLQIKYRITDNNGQDIVNTLNYFDEFRFHIYGKYFGKNNNYYLLRYIGYEVDCNQSGLGLLNLINSNTLKFYIAPHSDIIGAGCPDGNIHILPIEKESAVTLTKQ